MQIDKFEPNKSKDYQKTINIISDIFDDWNKEIKERKDFINSNWDQFLDENKKYVKRIQEILGIIKEKHEISTDVVEIKIEKL